MRPTHGIGTFLLCLSLAAQEQKGEQPAGKADGPQQAAAAEALLARACAVMQGLESVAFKSTEEQDPAMLRQLKKQAPGFGGDAAVEVEATISQGVVQLKLADGHEAVSHGNRTIAREGEGEWRLHRGTLANGDAIPFVLDPQMLFEELGRLPAKGKRDVKSETTKLKGQPAELVMLEVHGKAAQALAKSGLLPRFQGGGLLAIGPMKGMLPEPGAATYDLAFWVEPQSGQVLRMRVRGYQEDPAGGGGITIQVAGGGEEEGEEDEEKPAKGEKSEKAPKAIAIKDGLPERAKKRSVSTFDYEVGFSAHGKAKVAELPAEAQQLLRVPARR